MRFKQIWYKLSSLKGFNEQTQEQMFYTGALVVLDVIAKTQVHSELELVIVIEQLVSDLEKSLQTKESAV